MARHWLSSLHILLRNLKRVHNASPQQPELEQVHITIHQTHALAGLQNLGIVTNFVTTDKKRWSRDYMLLIFDLQIRLKCCTTESCSRHVASVLGTWIGEELSPYFTKEIKIERLYLTPCRRTLLMS